MTRFREILNENIGENLGITLKENSGSWGKFINVAQKKMLDNKAVEKYLFAILKDEMDNTKPPIQEMKGLKKELEKYLRTYNKGLLQKVKKQGENKRAYKDALVSFHLMFNIGRLIQNLEHIIFNAEKSDEWLKMTMGRIYNK